MSLYPRLFENPNAIYDPKTDEEVDWNHTDTLPFSYYNDELFIGNPGDTHDNMRYNQNFPQDYEGDARGKYSGRLFFDYKIVTFWHFPEDKETLKKILNDLQDKLSKGNFENFKGKTINFFDNKWKIEVPNNYRNLTKYPRKSKNDNTGIYPNWGGWYPTKKSQKFIKPEDYNKKYERPPEELKIQHLIPPSAGKKPVPYGYGSKSPKYHSKRQWQMATLGDESVHEPFYPSLFEAGLYTKGAGNTFLLRELANKYPTKYKYSTGKRIENIAKTSDEEFKKDFLEVADEFNVPVVKSTVRFAYPGQPGAVSGKFPGLRFELDGKDYGVKYSGVSSGGHMTQTPTVFKEGLVVYFFQTNEIYEPFNKATKDKTENYFDVISRITKDIMENRIKGMDEKDVDYILRVLDQEGKEWNLDFANGIFNAMSVGNKLKDTNFTDWEIYRDKFFTDIKKEAAKGIGFAANAVDKWNPMDIMLVKPGKKQEILDKWAEAAQREEGDEQLKLGDYNNIFVDDLETENPNVIALAISLKEQSAQGGKGKSYISRVEKVADKYNLTKEEQSWDQDKFMQEIITQRNKIPTNIANLEEADTFNYRLEGNVDGFNIPEASKAKYGSLKMLNYLLEKVPENNMFINLAAYSLSLGQNPAFFKFQGSKDGNAERVHIYKFPQSGGVSLYNKAYNDYDGKIFIRDGNNNAGLEIKYYIVTAEILYSVTIQIRANQGTRRVDKNIQVNIEVQKITEIENLAEEMVDDNFYPQLYEKFVEKSDPIRDMGIGFDFELQGIEFIRGNNTESETISLSPKEVNFILSDFNNYENSSDELLFIPKADKDILDYDEMRGLKVKYQDKIYQIPK